MAKKKTWADKIRKACKDAGTYRPFFYLAINQLAEIMEIRDKAKEQFEESGGNPVVMHTNKAGHKNIVKNPALVVINECNQQALAGGTWDSRPRDSKGSTEPPSRRRRPASRKCWRK